jgi:2-keto-4-pentenoate hydratase/2-oxohepta-3-ene-1,7-dioic acid hydratase in catechol pathway
LLLYRIAPEGFYAARAEDGVLRLLYSDPFETRPGGWRFGRALDESALALLAPVVPGKIVGIGRNYRDHAAELGNPMPAEPLMFLKSPSSLSGPLAPIVLPPESERVEFEGEIAVVLRQRLRRASPEEARAAILGVTCACDVTARDLQRQDSTFVRAKSFDSFCPVGPALWVDADPDDITVSTTVNGVERQRGHTRDMSWGVVELLVYVSRFLTLEAGDLLLTGTPAGVAALAAGDRVAVEIPGVGILENPVEAWAASA